MKKETIFRKVKVTDRLPEYGQRVIALVLEQNDLGLSKYLCNVEYDDSKQIFKQDGREVNVEYWLEEIDMPSHDNLQDKNVKLRLGLGKLLNICLNTKQHHVSEVWHQQIGFAKQIFDETDPKNN